MGSWVCVVEAAGRERSHFNLPPQKCTGACVGRFLEKMRDGHLVKLGGKKEGMAHYFFAIRATVESNFAAGRMRVFNCVKVLMRLYVYTLLVRMLPVLLKLDFTLTSTWVQVIMTEAPFTELPPRQQASVQVL